MRSGRQLHPDRVTGPDLTVGHHDRHHSGQPLDVPPGLASQHRAEQTRLEPIELDVRIAKPGDLDHRMVAEVKHRARETRARAQYGSVSIGEIHHKLSFKVDALATNSALRDIVQVAWSDQTSEWHFARGKSFPCSTARSGC